MAVSAPVQRDSDIQRELFHLKEVFEENLRTYDGDDPLVNWYDYILKIEECYLKVGDTNNLIPLLEKCLQTFEGVTKYANDRRLIQLLIKYIDLQHPNPIEIYQILHARKIGTQCAYFYIAWAMYHELAGNFKLADHVFEMGMWEFAQPYEELVIAQKNMVFMAGLHFIHGPDERRMTERKQVLNYLHRNKYNQTSFHNTCQPGEGHHPSLPFLVNPPIRQAPTEQLMYQSNDSSSVRNVSNGGLLETIRNRESQDAVQKAPVEDVTPNNGTLEQPQNASNAVIPSNEGIRLFPNFYSTNHDDYTDWQIEVCYPEPPLPTVIPMYPKHLVYIDNTEYSLEEIRARKYLAKLKEKLQQIIEAESLSDHHMTETEQAVQGILPNRENLEHSMQNSSGAHYNNMVNVNYSQQNIPENYPSRQSYYPNVSNTQDASKFAGFSPQPSPQPRMINEKGDAQANISQNYLPNSQSFQPHNSHSHSPAVYKEKSVENNRSLGNIADDLWSDVDNFWKDETQVSRIVEVPKQAMQAFQIHEDTRLGKDTTLHVPTPVKNNIKTPFTNRPDEASRKENDRVVFSVRKNENYNENMNQLAQNTFLSQPQEPNENIRQNLFMSQGNFISPSRIGHQQGLRPNRPFLNNPEQNQMFVHPVYENPNAPPLNDSCNTQMFNYNLKLASTPYNPKKLASQEYNNEQFGNEIKNEETDTKPKQRLFNDIPEDEVPNDKWYGTQLQSQEKLSVIYETTKEFHSSASSGSSSGGTTLKTTLNAYSLKAIPEETSQVNNSHSQLYQNTQTNENYSHIDKYESLPQHFQDMQNASIRNVRSEITETSYRMNLQDELLLARNKTPSPSSRMSIPYNNTQTLHNNQTTQNTINFSLLREKEPMQVKRLPLPNEESCIYIDDDETEVNKSNMMHCTADNFQSQSKNFSKVTKMHESPAKNHDLFFDGSNDSNSVKDIWGRSPAKGSRMDIDGMSQHSSELRMDYDSLPEPPKDDTILQKTPSDPFSKPLIKALLKKVGFPQQTHLQNYVLLQNIPRLLKKENCCLGDERYLIGNIIGKGNYGSVFKATRLSNNEIVALKLQKPSNQWEFYICNEIQNRIANPFLRRAFMSVQVGYFCPTSSLLVSDFCRFGSLLDISNKVKQVTGKGVKELVVIYLANEIVTIINALHHCQIIHADIKPDNFLVMKMPPELGHPCLQLIDFGCSIDMSLFPKDTAFTKVINTENFTCPEMKDGRPWTYQTDLFCVAATVHVLLFEKYMQLQKKDTVWNISNRVPRYMRTDLWNTFFFQFLNIDGCNNLPDLMAWKKTFETILSDQNEELQVEMRGVANSIIGR